MTRAERTAEREQHLKDQLAAVRRKRLQAEAQARAKDRATQYKRRQLVGTMADEAGLLVWDDATLAGIFEALATLTTTPNPVGMLEGLLLAEDLATAIVGASPGSADMS